MAHVVMQAAEFPRVELAIEAEKQLGELRKAYIEFEKTDPDPWGFKEVPKPLLEFGARHGVDWPHRKDARFLVKDSFDEATRLIRIERMVFFYGGGFDLGGPTLRSILSAMGAEIVDEFCYLKIRSETPDQRLEELVEFLEDEELEDQFEIDPEDRDDFLHLLEIKGPRHSRILGFDDSGVSDWAFIHLIPQLDGEDPSFIRREEE